MSDTAVAEPPQKAAASSQPSFMEGMAAARAKSHAVGGVEGENIKATASAAKAAPEAKVAESVVKPEDAAAAKAKEAPVEKSASDMLAGLKTDPRKPEAKGESKPEEKVDPSKLSKEEKEQFTFKELRRKADEGEAHKKELDALKAKLNGTDIEAVLKERDDAKKTADERQKRLDALDVQESTWFRDNVAAPNSAIFKEIQDTSKEFNVDFEALARAIEIDKTPERNAAIGKILSAGRNASDEPIDPVTLASTARKIDEYLTRYEAGQKVIANASKAKEAMAAEEAARQKEQQGQAASEYERVAGIIFDKLTDGANLAMLPFLAVPDKNDAAGNPVLDMDKARKIREAAVLGEDAPEDRVLNQYSRALLPEALEQIKALRKQLAEKEDYIGKLAGAGPSGKQGVQEQTATSATDDKRPMSERLAELRAKHPMV